MIIDVILLPQVFEWTDSADIYENEAGEEDYLFSMFF